VTAPLFEARGIVKRYGHVEALRGADISIAPGEVHALIGDNGAGKSTFVKTIAGVIKPDAGELLVRGEAVTFDGPTAAQAAGIETVYQDLALSGTLDAGANVFLGREPLRSGIRGRLGFVDRAQMRERTAAQLEELGAKLPSDRAEVATMSGGQRQAIAVARAAVWATTMVIMDEPTAALGVRQTAFVLSLIERLRDQKGLSVLLISHNLPDVLRVADRITVLRLGRRARTFVAAETDLQELTLVMAGLEEGAA
jgi:ABC-type sugar transport system ATPase subunit